MAASAFTRHLPNALTLGNGLSGLAALLLCAASVYQGNPAAGLHAAFLCIALGVLCDTLDGPLARLLRVNNPMGAQLDSLCDGASFGVATAGVVALAFMSVTPLLGAALAAWWLCAVLLRLARFNLDNDSTTAHQYFSGLCSPVAALLLCAVLDVSADTTWFPWLPLAVALLLPALMLSRIRFVDLPKYYLTRRRLPWELLPTAAVMLLYSPALGVGLYLGGFVLLTLWQQWRGAAAASRS